MALQLNGSSWLDMGRLFDLFTPGGMIRCVQPCSIDPFSASHYIIVCQQRYANRLRYELVGRLLVCLPCTGATSLRRDRTGRAGPAGIASRIDSGPAGPRHERRTN